MAKQIYEEITSKVIDELQKNNIPWQMPWKTGHVMPQNFTTGKPYSGINWMLGMMYQLFSGNPAMFATFKQAAGKKDGEYIGVKKGQKAEHEIFFFGFIYKDSNDNTVPWGKLKNMSEAQKAKLKKIGFLKASKVFNITQCDGYEDLLPKTEINPEHTQNELAELFVANLLEKTNLELEEKTGNNAGLQSNAPKIQISKPENFKSSEAYYSTLFHELTHFAGRPEHLDRPSLTDYFQDIETRAFEELVAELGAWFLRAHFGINYSGQDAQSQAYIDGWIQKLQSNPKWVYQASSLAQKSVDYLLEKADMAREVTA